MIVDINIRILKKDSMCQNIIPSSENYLAMKKYSMFQPYSSVVTLQGHLENLSVLHSLYI